MNQFSQYIEMKSLEPYRTEAEAVTELLRFTDALCFAVFTIRDLWGKQLEMRGIVITPAECQEALSPPAPPSDQAEREQIGRELRELFEYLTARGAVSSVRIWELCRKFGLNRKETLCFFLASALEFDRKYERLYGYIQDNVAAKQPSFGLGLSMCSLVFNEPEEGENLHLPGRLLSSGLFKREAGQIGESRLSSPMIVGDMAWNYLREGTWLAPLWKTAVFADWESCGTESETGGRETKVGKTEAVRRLVVSMMPFNHIRKEENRSLESAAGELDAVFTGLDAECVVLENERSERGREELEDETSYLGRILALNGLLVEYGTGTPPERLHVFCTPVKTVYGWDDLILEAESKNLLRQICNQVEYREIVKEQWGFGKKDPYGNGISALFFGPPGTGKTMAAQVIAGELGEKLYKVDISRLLSKYIGETEKHVSELFDAGKRSGAVLFFDEADGLFAKRSEVGSSNDRYANTETGFLLQKLEEYDGISILATNYVNNIDDAFKRRIRFLIRFPFPSVPMRALLWKRLIPEQAALDEDLRLDIPAERFDLSGSSIREVVIQAAYLAAAEGRGIRRADIGKALRLHYVKYGKNLREEELEW